MGRRQKNNSLSFVEPAEDTQEDGSAPEASGQPEPSPSAQSDVAIAPSEPAHSVDAAVAPEAQPAPVATEEESPPEAPPAAEAEAKQLAVEGSKAEPQSIPIVGQVVNYRQSNGKIRPAKVLEVGPDGVLNIEMLTNGHHWNDVPPGRDPGQWHLPHLAD